LKISDGEKLILLMLSELYEKLDVEGEIEPDFIKSAISWGHLWAIPWKYPGIPFEDQENPAIVEEVADILEMWSAVEYAYDDLSAEDKDKLAEDAAPFGNSPKFEGFDGNNESSHVSVARFLIDDLERFQEFKGRVLNCHHHSLSMHGRMLDVFHSVRENMTTGSLSLSDLTAILKGRIQPENT